ncbi:MAG: 1-acyl-sn-glycerol-3-phosphate acyltransferase [Ilumatobacteraceae bacterium]
MTLPPRWLRRIVLWPLPLLLVWFYVASVPLLLIVAFVVSYRLPGSFRAVRSLGLATVYVFVEVAIILASFGLWIATGFGLRLRSDWSIRTHYRVLDWALRTLVGGGRRLFSLDIEVRGFVRDAAGRHPVEPPGPIEHPLIVMSRHAGPADSILLMYELMAQFERRPRIVLREALQWDPAFDILLNRLPTHFVRHGADREHVLGLLRDLASDMQPGDAFVIFPEGATSPSGVVHAPSSTSNDREDGRGGARGLRQVLPPRTNGALAALGGCPSATPVFVAHTGLDEIVGPRSLAGDPRPQGARHGVRRRHPGSVARRRGRSDRTHVVGVGADRPVDRRRAPCARLHRVRYRPPGVVSKLRSCRMRMSSCRRRLGPGTAPAPRPCAPGVRSTGAHRDATTAARAADAVSRRSEPVVITHEDVIDGHDAELLWEAYHANFHPLAELAILQHLYSRDEVLAELANPRILKIVGRQGGRPVGMGMVTNSLEDVPQISPAFLRARHPDHAERNAIYFGILVMVSPDHRGRTLFSRLYTEMWQVPARAGGVLRSTSATSTGWRSTPTR